jgi:hypothetical protein
MYYRDMIAASVNNFSFAFKLANKLVHFGSDFDPSNANHSIVIELATKLNSDSIKSKILPLVRGNKIS